MGLELIEKLHGVLGYPREYTLRLVSELSALNVIDLLSEGPVEFMGFRILGKGHSSLVLKCIVGSSSFACKLRRFDSPRGSLTMEAHHLRIANSVNVGPRLHGAMDDVIVMELIEGVSLEDYVLSSSESSIRDVVASLLSQGFALDSVGLSHGELSRPERHIVVMRGKPYILDFESASTSRGTSNVTQLCNALFMRNGPMQRRIRDVLSINPETLRARLREYRRCRCLVEFKMILREVGLIP